MAFWNRKKHNDRVREESPTERLTRTIVTLNRNVEGLWREVDQLRDRVNAQPVPTNGQSRDGSAVQDWLPVVDRMQELLLVQMGNADLAQAFGTYARQRELRASEEQPGTAWTEPNESTYENL